MADLAEEVHIAQMAEATPTRTARRPRKSAAKKVEASKAVVAQTQVPTATKRKRPLRGAAMPMSPKNVRARDQANKALELRKAGMNWSRIAQQLGYHDGTGARKAVDRVLIQTADESSDTVRQLELHRLDAIWEQMYLKAIKGDRLAVDRCLKIMERRAAYLGLDAPIRIQQMVITEEQLDEAIERIEAEAAALEARSYAEGEDRPEWMDDPIIIEDKEYDEE